MSVGKKTDNEIMNELTKLRQRVAELKKSEAECKKLKKTLLQSEKRFKDITKNASEWIWELDLAGKYTYASPAVKAILGYKPEEVLKIHIYDLFHPEDRKNLKKKVFRMFVKKQSFRKFINRCIHKNGRTVWLSTSGVPVFGDKGDLLGYRGVNIDITEQRQAMDSLAQSERRYRILVETLQEGLGIVDLDENIVFANSAFCNIFGYPREKLIGMNLGEFISRDELEKVRQETAKRKKNAASQYELRIKRKDGAFRDISIHASPWLNEKGECKGTIGVLLDITEQKRAQEALQESEEKYRIMIEHSNDMIWTLDLEGNFTYVNKRAEQISGHKLDDGFGKHFTTLIPPEDLPRIQKVFLETMSGKSQHYEVNVYKKDGSVFVLSVNTAPLFKSGKIVGTVSFGRDITKQKQTQEALGKSEEKYKTFVNNVNVGIYRNTVGPKGKFIDANPAVIKMFGYESKDEFLSIDVADLYQNPEDRERFNEKMLANGFVRDEELQLKKKDGKPIFCSVFAVVVKDEQGKIKYYDGIIEDITKRKKVEQELKTSYKKLKKILNGTINALASTTEKRDPYTAGHQQRVTQLACVIAREMGFSEERIEGMRMACMVHDIGKIYVAAEILNKPVRLTDIEMALIKTHCQIGYEILKTIEFPLPIAEIVLQHHERMDGSGYPQGLKGKDILHEAKILAVVDVVEAMSSHRPYRSSFGVDLALNEIKENRGKLYDPEIVDVCLKLFTEKGFKFN